MARNDALAKHVKDCISDGITGRETLENKERGCGFLQPNKGYIRTDVDALSAPGGDIPRFVMLDDPVEYRTGDTQGAIIPGYKRFPGLKFALAYHAGGGTTTPSGDIDDALARRRQYGFDGDYYTDITVARAHDLLLSVGKSHWATPEDYVTETRRRGCNLAIPISKSNEPPPIVPLRTRAWIIHPHGYDEGHPAIIGYAYLTRVVYTTGTNATESDPDVPGNVEEWATVGKVDLVDRGDPHPSETTTPSEVLATFARDDDLDFDERRDRLDKAFDDNALRSLVDAKGIDADGTDRQSLLDALAAEGATVQ